MGKDKEKDKEPVARDIPLIGCGVCEKVVSNIFIETDKARDAAAYKKIEEIQIDEILDDVCKPDSPKGEWIRKINIAEKTQGQKSYLFLEEPGGSSKCERECGTIAQSCNNLLQEEIDRDELSALLWKNKITQKDLKDKVCKKWTSRCSSQKYIPASYKRTDFPFKPVSEKDLQMEQLMAEMKKAGMGGMSMYNRDDMDALASGGMDAYADGDEGDEYGGGAGSPPPPNSDPGSEF